MTSDKQASGVERKALKFADGPQTTLAIAQKAGEVAATVRYDDEKGIEEGDVLDVLSARTSEKVGTADVKHSEEVEVRRALDVVSEWWANYGIETRERLISELNAYYEETIDQTTEVKVLILDPSLTGQLVDDPEDAGARFVPDGGEPAGGVEQRDVTCPSCWSEGLEPREERATRWPDGAEIQRHVCPNCEIATWLEPRQGCTSGEDVDRGDGPRTDGGTDAGGVEQRDVTCPSCWSEGLEPREERATRWPDGAEIQRHVCPNCEIATWLEPRQGCTSGEDVDRGDGPRTDGGTDADGVERTVPPCPDCGSEEVNRKEGFITCYNCEFYANSAGPSTGLFSHHRTGDKYRFVRTDGGASSGRADRRRTADTTGWSVFGYPGNKAKLAAWIIPHFADHSCYVEPFGGAAGVLANKPESKVEVYNDRDGDLVQFFEVLRDRGAELVEWLTDVPYSRELYEDWAPDWYDGWRPEDPVERAGVFFYLRQTAFGGKYRYKGGFATSTTRNQAMTYRNQVDRLHDFAERFRGQVVLENLDWHAALEKYDDEETLFYLDPPYADAKLRYRYGEDFDHEAFASALEDTEARWVVSYGAAPEPVREVAETIVERTTKYQMAAGTNGEPDESTETLVLSYDPDEVEAFVDDQAELDRFVGADAEAGAKQTTGVERSREVKR